MHADKVFEQLEKAVSAELDCFAIVKDWFKGANTLARFERLRETINDHGKARGYTRNSAKPKAKLIAARVAKYVSVIGVYYSDRKDGVSFREVHPKMDFADWLQLGLTAMESMRKDFKSRTVTVPPMDSDEILREIEKAEHAREIAQVGLVDSVMAILKIAGIKVTRKVVTDSYATFCAESRALAIAEAKEKVQTETPDTVTV